MIFVSDKNVKLVEESEQYMYQKWIKRIVGLLMALLITVCISPVLLLIAIAIKCESRGPVLFKQKRVGLHKELFEIYKFRSMRADTPKDKIGRAHV